MASAASPIEASRRQPRHVGTQHSRRRHRLPKIFRSDLSMRRVYPAKGTGSHPGRAGREAVMQPLWERWQAEPCLPRLQPRRDSRLRKGRPQRAQPPAGASAEPTSPFGVSLRARPYGVNIDRRSWLHGMARNIIRPWPARCGHCGHCKTGFRAAGSDSIAAISRGVARICGSSLPHPLVWCRLAADRCGRRGMPGRTDSTPRPSQHARLGIRSAHRVVRTS
jgi:hypothetical protein